MTMHTSNDTYTDNILLFLQGYYCKAEAYRLFVKSAQETQQREKAVKNAIESYITAFKTDSRHNPKPNIKNIYQASMLAAEHYGKHIQL